MSKKKTDHCLWVIGGITGEIKMKLIQCSSKKKPLERMSKLLQQHAVVGDSFFVKKCNCDDEFKKEELRER